MAELAIFAETMAGAELPRQLSFVSMELVGPILIAFGTPAQQDRFLPRLLSGDDIWCQLFSEPGAGSDLAAVATRASKVGDDWEASGQKIWTSGAHYSQYGLLLARTGPRFRRTRASPASPADGPRRNRGPSDPSDGR